MVFRVRDLPLNQRWAIRLLAQSRARATGNWGRTLRCVPADARAWKNSVAQPFNRVGRAANYQRYKCGSQEGSVHEDRQRGRAPVADGLSPTASNPSRRGCLILEAKSSRHPTATRQNSLYSLETRSGNALSRRDRERLTERYRELLRRTPWAAVGDGISYIGGTLVPATSSFQIEGGDTSILEDLIPSASDHRTSGIWALVRSQSMMQLGFYEAACVIEDVPYVKYVVIFERAYMRAYFRSIRTPNMLLSQSAFQRNPTWRNG